MNRPLPSPSPFGVLLPTPLLPSLPDNYAEVLDALRSEVRSAQSAPPEASEA